MASLAEIRAKLKEQAGKGSNESKQGGDNSVYPFWNLKEGGEATIRFLPDADTNNTFFWVERAMIKLQFPGVKGASETKPVTVNVPCMEMYGETCPVLTEVRPWYKDAALKEMANKYWKKRSYIFQGFVTEDGLKEEATPENGIRRFIIGPQIFALIKGALLDPEMDDLPTDTVNGVDFKVVKTSKGGYADYATSKWSRRSRPLDAAENANIEQHGLFELKSFLPKKPTEVEIKIIKEMFEASVDGEPYDLEKWGQYFKPAGMGQGTGDPNTSAPAATPAAKSMPAAKAAPAADDTPWEDDVATAEKAVAAKEAAPAASGGRAEDILAMIRNRAKQ